jgi:hypothetical protein
MPHQIERKFAFGPSALNDLAQAFDTAWLELRAWGIEATFSCLRLGTSQRPINALVSSVKADGRTLPPRAAQCEQAECAANVRRCRASAATGARRNQFNSH